MLKILGVLDILAAISLILLNFGLLPVAAALFAIYIFIKSIVFFKDISSIIDLAVFIIFILALFGTYNFLTYAAIIWLLQKGIVSLL